MFIFSWSCLILPSTPKKVHDAIVPEAANVCVTTSTKRNENNGTEAKKQYADSKQHTLTTLMGFWEWVGWRVPDRNVLLLGPLRNVGRCVFDCLWNRTVEPMESPPSYLTWSPSRGMGVGCYLIVWETAISCRLAKSSLEMWVDFFCITEWLDVVRDTSRTGPVCKAGQPHLIKAHKGKLVLDVGQ